MPVQTPMSSENIYVADGASCKIAANTPTGTPTYTDMGITKGDAEFKIEWKADKTLSGNAGYFPVTAKDLKITGKFTLYTKDPDVMEILAGGLLKKTTDDAASTTPNRVHLKAGSTFFNLAPVEFCFEHKDTANKIRGLKIFNATVASGSFGFTFLGADSEGRETIEVSFEATPDGARVDGESLFDQYTDPGAQ